MHIRNGIINAESYIQVLEQHVLQSRRRVFQVKSCILKQDDVKAHAASITAAQLHSSDLNWPVEQLQSLRQQ